jgi:hypothetical protein
MGRKTYVVTFFRLTARSPGLRRPAPTLALAPWLLSAALALGQGLALPCTAAEPRVAAPASSDAAATPSAPAVPAAASAPAAATPAEVVESNELPAAADRGPGKLAPCPTIMGSLPSSGLDPVNPATAALIRDRLKERVGLPTSICRTPFGLYEVIVDGDLFYVDERANFLLAGNAFDLRTTKT